MTLNISQVYTCYILKDSKLNKESISALTFNESISARSRLKFLRFSKIFYFSNKFNKSPKVNLKEAIIILQLNNDISKVCIKFESILTWR